MLVILIEFVPGTIYQDHSIVLGGTVLYPVAEAVNNTFDPTVTDNVLADNVATVYDAVTIPICKTATNKANIIPTPKILFIFN